ncbi:MAG: calcium/sodium antiporter [Gemmatimonadetes bacterium]|nr:calcium/sodium antiporter [Gemmatimonadota bacterium]NNM07408.1 calcium/sodium antiporter [Gemmatimonadota bacterium]
MPLMVLLLLAGFAALYFGADWMVRGAARLQGSLGLSPIVIGLTVVSLGTSAPELIVAILATLRGNADIAVGNVLGSNLANIGLILGTTAMVRPLLVADRVVRREIPIMILLTVLLFPVAMNHEVGRVDGVFLVSLLAAYLTYVFYRGRKAPAPLISGYSLLGKEAQAKRTVEIFMDIGLLVAGTVGLLMGGRAIVESAIYLSRNLGVSELGMGLTVVAIGTSLPELATSIMAAAKKQTDIAVGNVIGSNIFNILAVLGVTGMIKPVAVDPGVLWVELPAVVMLSLLVLLVSLFPMTKGEFRIRRWEGALLLGTYLWLGSWIL